MFAKMELNPDGVKGMTMDALSNYDIDVMRDWVRNQRAVRLFKLQSLVLLALLNRPLSCSKIVWK
jgi:hypothetical protein